MSETEFRKAFQAYKDSVYRFAYRMTGSDQMAQDVVQDCFLLLWQKPSAYDEHRGGLRAFLMGIARHLIYRHWRKFRLIEPLDEESFVCGPLDVFGKERDQTVAQAVQLLPPSQREALILAEYEELSLAEIAQATQAEIAAVKSRLHRARQHLRRMLGPVLEGKENLYGTKR